jgi:NADPH:quinone reductase-like Zn-dependent oxidoreductase
MHAVVIADGRLSWQERPDPQVGDHDLLMAVRATGVNGADLVQRRGLYPAPPGWPPDIPGLELAGDVLSVGSRVTRFAPGQRVMALVGGAQTTLATVDEAHAPAVPESLPWPEAGSRLRVPVGETFPLPEAAAAYERFARGGKLGKIVLIA